MSLVDLGKRLLDAAKRGDTEEVRTLMANGAPFTTDWLGTSPLHFAAQCGHQHTAEVLLRAGISRDARTKVDRTPLHVAAQEGNVSIVDLLLAHSADIEAKDMLKMTPLHWATEKGNRPVLESLIKHGADVTCENKFDRTPLDIALRNGRPDLVPLLQGGTDATIALAETEPETITIETSETTITTDLDENVTADTETVITTTIDEGVIHETEEDPNIIPVQVFPNSNLKVTDCSDQNSTSVLATLAAIAEATAPNTVQNSSNNEVMNWLESQGITMISTSDGNIISSAVESGQTISLTEAGKIALNIIQQQGDTEEGEANFETTDVENIGTHDQQKVITIVTEQSGEEISTEETPLLVTVGEDGTVIESTEVPEVEEQESEALEPPLKRIKIEPGTELTDSHVLDISQLLEKSSETGVDKDELRKQLEAVQKQAEEYKLQLHQKEQEAEVYKQQLSEITSKAPS